MSIRNTLFVTAFLAAVAVPAFAAPNRYIAADRGEATYSGPMPGDVVQQTPRATSVFGGSSSGYVSERGEASYSGPMPGKTAQQTADANCCPMGASSGVALSRAQVVQELKAFQRNPVTATGYRYVNGEIGYVYVGPKFPG